MPTITFNKGNGGLGRPLPGKDHVSGLVYYIDDASLPAGFSTVDRTKKVFSLKQAEALGITTAAATAVLHYFISEFFRINTKGELWIGLYSDAAITLTEVELLQSEANGEIRQAAVYQTTAFAGSDVTTLQTSASLLEDLKMPLSIIYTADFSAVLDLSALPDLRALAAPNVSVVLLHDGAATGAALAASTGVSVPALGAALGIVSLKAVNESPAWVEFGNLVTGKELEIASFANGDNISLYTTTEIEAFSDLGYCVGRYYVGRSGTYFADFPTASPATGDYAYIENERTIDKALRSVYTFLLPLGNSPILLNADGTLTDESIAIFQNAAERGLDPMLAASEISAFEVLIDSAQNVLSTSEIVITGNIIPVGVARAISFNLNFVTSLTTA